MATYERDSEGRRVTYTCKYLEWSPDFEYFTCKYKQDAKLAEQYQRQWMEFKGIVAIPKLILPKCPEDCRMSDEGVFICIEFDRW